MRRTSLATRISLFGVGVAALTAVIAGALAVGLIRSSGADTARRNLGRLADLAQSAVTTGRETNLPGGIRSALRELDVQAGVIGPFGRVVTSSPLVRDALTAQEIAGAEAGRSLSLSRRVDGTRVFVEVRPVGRGAVILVQTSSAGVADDNRAVRRIILAVLVAGGLAALLGLLVAWRLARPLRRSAAAARSLAAGNRDVALPAEGPVEIVEVSDAVTHLAEALRHSEGRQRDFLLSVSHDLRTPLTAIMGYAESLTDGVVPTQDAPQVAAVVLAEARRLDRLVADLLDLARLGAQDFRVEIAPVELGALLQGIAQVWDARCAAAGVSFRLDAPQTAVWTATDPARLRQALDGLFDNALRVTPPGAPIVLAAHVADGQAVVEVRDGGPGLHDADLPVAFEQGVLHARYQGVREVGTGLGLAIVRGLVTRLGGTVDAGHAAEGGARFTVRLPLAR